MRPLVVWVRNSSWVFDHIDDSAARKAYQDAESTLNSVRKDLDKAQNELERLFDPEWFGPEGEWKKLEGTCLAKDTGE